MSYRWGRYPTAAEAAEAKAKADARIEANIAAYADSLTRESSRSVVGHQRDRAGRPHRSVSGYVRSTRQPWPHTGQNTRRRSPRRSGGLEETGRSPRVETDLRSALLVALATGVAALGRRDLRSQNVGLNSAAILRAALAGGSGSINGEVIQGRNEWPEDAPSQLGKLSSRQP